MNTPNDMTLQATIEQSPSRRSSRRKTSWSHRFGWAARIALLIGLLAAPWMIASVQYWAQHVVTISLLVSVGFWWFDTAVNQRESQALPYIGFFVAAGLFLALFQLVPLSGSLAETILGRQAELYRQLTVDPGAASQSVIARVTLDVDRTWHYVRLLTLVLTALFLGCRYFRDRTGLILFLGANTANGVALTFFGLVQKFTYNGKLFWTVTMTHPGSPFGPFVNRNNAGGYLLICLACAIGLLVVLMAARKHKGPVPILSREIPFWRQLHFQVLYFISELTAARMAVLIGIIFIASGIVATLSRGAVTAMGTGALLTLVFYGMARKPKHMSLFALPMIAGFLALVGWIGFGDELISRFETIDTANLSETDARFRNWTDTWPAVAEMGWFGSGLGSYHGLHRLYRTDVETTIFEYPENMYFQALVEAGWPGFALYLMAWVFAFYLAGRLLFRGKTPSMLGTGVCAFFLLSSQAVASFFDYGFIVPSNSLLLAATMGVISYQAQSMGHRQKQPSWLGFKAPNFAVSLILVAVFAGLTLVALDLHRRSSIQSIVRTPLPENELGIPEAEALDQQIAMLNDLSRRTPSVLGMNRLGELWILRSRVQFLNQMLAVQSIDDISDEGRQEIVNRMWNLTSLGQLHRHVEELRRQSTAQAQRFANQPFIRGNLAPGAEWYRLSRNTAPLQPRVHMRLGELTGVIGSPEEWPVHLERACLLAPRNPEIRMRVALQYLRAGNFSAAAPHLRAYLDLKPDQFARVMNILLGESVHAVPEIDPEQIAELVLPDDPGILFEFAMNFAENAETRDDALFRARDLLADATIANRDRVILLAQVLLALGDYESALEPLGLAVRSRPGDHRTRYIFAKALFEHGELDEAEDNAKQILSLEPKNRRYEQLLSEIQAAIRERDKKN